MKYFTLFVSQIYRFTINEFFTFLGRLFWYIKMIFAGRSSWQNITDKMKTSIQYMDDFDDLKNIYSQYQWTRDGLFDCDGVFNRYPTWRATVRIIFFRGLRGNCDDAEVLSKWLFDNYIFSGEDNPKYEKNIYVPVNPSNYDKAHYFATVKTNGVELQFSSGSISEETRDELAVRYLGEQINYVWLN